MTSLILPVHVLAGGVGLLAGYVALYAAKGATVHRKSGLIFVYAMLTMSILGIVLTLGHPWQVVNVPAGLMTSYLVLTALITVRPPTPSSRALGVGLMVMALAAGAVVLSFGIEAVANGGRRGPVPAFPFFLFAFVGLIGGVGDLRVLRSGPLTGRPRLARHLWRISFALFIAAMSFFLGQADVIPAPIRHRGLLALPVVAVLVTMCYWLWKVRRPSLRIPSPGAPIPRSARAVGTLASGA